MSLKIHLSARPGLQPAKEMPELGTYRKDYVIAGNWHVRTADGTIVLGITPERMQKWERTHHLLMSRGVTVPLTVDHMEIRDPATGKMLQKKLTPAMAEAKRGTVELLETEGNRGFCRVKPTDKEAVTLLARCPEVSLELTYDFIDGSGNYYEEAITAITLTPKPVIQGQQQDWVPVSKAVHASHGAPIYLSAEPVVSEEDPARPSPQPDLNSETPMTPEQIAEVRKILKLGAEVKDAEIAGKLLGHVTALETSRAADADRIVQLSRDVENKTTELKAAGAKTIRLSITDIAKEIDPDGLDMMGTAIKARIDALASRGYSPAQRTMLSQWLVGTPAQRNVIALSRKAAEQIGLPEPLANKVLEILEAGNPAEMLAALTEQSKTQKRGVALSHTLPNPAEPAAHDENLTKQMINNCNAGVASKVAEAVL